MTEMFDWSGVHAALDRFYVEYEALGDELFSLKKASAYDDWLAREDAEKDKVREAFAEATKRFNRREDCAHVAVRDIARISRYKPKPEEEKDHG